MAVNSANFDQGVTTTGIVIVVRRDPDTPPDTTAVIERIAYSGSAQSGSWSEVGTLQNCSTLGDAFFDFLPSDGKVWGYRSYHSHPAFQTSSYIFETSGSAQPIPDLDWSARPWLQTVKSLQLVMVLDSFNSGSWTVKSDVNQPVDGPVGTAPKITVLSSNNVGTIVTGSLPDYWVIARPTSSSLNSTVTFRSTLAGFDTGIDTVELPAPNDFVLGDWISIKARVVQEFSTASLVEASGSNASNAPMYVAVDSVYNTTYSIVTPWNGTGSLILAQRPSNGTVGTVRYIATSSVARLVDFDNVTIARQDVSLASGSFLEIAVNITGSTATHAHVSCSVKNLSASPIGYGWVNPVGGVGTPVRSGFSSFNVPLPSTGVGSVTFFVTSSNLAIESDSDQLTVASFASSSIPQLKIIPTIIAATSGSMIVSCSFFDPKGTASGSYSSSIQPANRMSYFQSTPGTFVIDRPLAGSGDGQIQFFVSAAGRLSDSDFIQLPEQSSGLVNLHVRLDQVAPFTPTQMFVSASGADPLDQFPVVMVPTAVNCSYTGPDLSGVYTITRPLLGLGSGLFSIKATAFGRQSDSDSIAVPESPTIKRASKIALLGEQVDVGGTYGVGFVLSGWTNVTQSVSDALHRGTQNTQSSSLSPALTGSYTPYVAISELTPGGTTRFFRPSANSGSFPPHTEYNCFFTPDPGKSYSTRIHWDGDTYNESVDLITAGIQGIGSGSAGFIVTSARGLSDTIFGYPTLAISDPNHVISQSAHPLQAYTRVGPAARVGPINPTTQPATGSSGNYQFQIALNPSALTHVEVFANMADSSTQTVSTFVFDETFYPFITPSVAYSGSTATISGFVDRLTPTGSNTLFYKVAGPSAFSSASIGVDYRFTFDIPLSQVVMKTVLMNAKNVNGVLNPVDFTIDLNQYAPPAATRAGLVDLISMDNPSADNWVLRYRLKGYTDYTSTGSVDFKYVVDSSQIDNVFVTGGLPKVNVFEVGTATVMEIWPAHNHLTGEFSASYSRQTGSAALQWRVSSGPFNQFTGWHDNLYTTPAKIVTPTENRTVSNVSAYLSNNKVYNVADFGAALDGVTNDGPAFNRAAFAANSAGGIAYLEVPGLMNIATHISCSRAVTLIGHGVNSTSGIVASSQKSLYIIGSAPARHMIRDSRFARVNVVYGNTSADYGRECSMDNVLIEDCPADAGVVYRHHSYITNLNNVHITSCLYGVYYDFATAVSDSGAKMVISNSTIDVCTYALYVNGMTADGCQIFISDTDLEHCTSAVLRAVSAGSAGEAMIFFSGVNLELNNGSIFVNDGMQIWLDKFVALSVTENEFIRQSSGHFWMSNGRLSWAPNKFAKMDGGYIYVEPGTIRSSARWFSEGVINTGQGGGFGNAVQMATSGSTGGRIQLPGQTQMRSQINATLTTITNASPGPVTASTFWKLDGNNRTWQVVVDCSVTTANNFLRTDVTNGVSTVRNDLNFPLFNGTAYLTISYIAGYEFKVRGTYVETATGKVTNVSSTTSDYSTATNYDRALVFTTETLGGTRATMAITIIEEVVSGQEIVGL